MPLLPLIEATGRVTGVAAENLKQVLGHTFDHEKRTNGVEIHAAN